MKTLRLPILLLALLVSAFGLAQTADHWVNRQLHGTARHLTPRHHKPGTPDRSRHTSYSSRRHTTKHTVRHTRSKKRHSYR